MSCSFCTKEDRGVHDLFSSQCRIQKVFDNPAWPVPPTYCYNVPWWADTEMRAMLLARALYLVMRELDQGRELTVIPMKTSLENGLVVEYAFIVK